MLKNLLLLSAFTTFVVAVWIGLTIKHNLTDTTISKPTQSHIIPITPGFDIKTISELKKRDTINASLANQTEILAKNSTKSALQNTLDSVFPTPQTASPGGSF